MSSILFCGKIVGTSIKQLKKLPSRAATLASRAESISCACESSNFLECSREDSQTPIFAISVEDSREMNIVDLIIVFRSYVRLVLFHSRFASNRPNNLSSVAALHLTL